MILLNIEYSLRDFYVNTETRYIGAIQFRRYNAIFSDGWRCSIETVWLLFTLFQCLRKSLSESTQYSAVLL